MKRIGKNMGSFNKNGNYEIILRGLKVSINGGEFVKLVDYPMARGIEITQYTIPIGNKEVNIYIRQLLPAIAVFEGKNIITGKEYEFKPIPGWGILFIWWSFSLCVPLGAIFIKIILCIILFICYNIHLFADNQSA